MAFLTAKGHVGYPPTKTTDSRLGYLVMLSDSAEIRFGSREGHVSILVRPEGSCTRAHPGAKNELAQSAKVGYCPFCTKETHIAAPARYTVREFSNGKAHGLTPWGANGPWAERRSAACLYAKLLG